MAHELRDETGYELDQLMVLQPSPVLLGEGNEHPLPLLFNTGPFPSKTLHYHTNLTYGFITDQQPRHAVGEGESDTLQWLTASELAALPAGACFPDVPGIYQQLLTGWRGWRVVPADNYTI